MNSSFAGESRCHSTSLSNREKAIWLIVDCFASVQRKRWAEGRLKFKGDDDV